MIKIIWNGVDSYIELEQAARRGYNVESDTLYTQRESFTAFEAVEIDVESLPMVDGERDFDGILGSESGKLYRAA